MTLNLWIISVVLGLALIGGAGYHVYSKGVESGKVIAKAEQDKHEKKVKKNDIKIDKNTPFSADRDTQLKWMYGYTIRQ